MATIPRTVRTKCCNHKAIGPPMVTDVAVFRPWEFGTFAPAAPELRATQCREGALAPLTGCGYVRSGMRCASTDGTWGLGLGLGATCAPETLNGELKPDNDLMEAWAGCIAREFRLIVRQRSGRYTPVRARYRLTVTASSSAEDGETGRFLHVPAVRNHTLIRRCTHTSGRIPGSMYMHDVEQGGIQRDTTLGYMAARARADDATSRVQVPAVVAPPSVQPLTLRSL